MFDQRASWLRIFLPARNAILVIRPLPGSRRISLTMASAIIVQDVMTVCAAPAKMQRISCPVISVRPAMSPWRGSQSLLLIILRSQAVVLPAITAQRQRVKRLRTSLLPLIVAVVTHHWRGSQPNSAIKALPATASVVTMVRMQRARISHIFLPALNVKVAM